MGCDSWELVLGASGDSEVGSDCWCAAGGGGKKGSLRDGGGEPLGETGAQTGTADHSGQSLGLML